MRFDEAVQYLLDLGHETLAIKLGLRNTELLLQSLNNPESFYPAVQIAGTNGKGSVAVVLDSICRQAAIRTGLYTSPHLSSITERIRLSGSEISKEEFAGCASTVREAAEKLLDQNHIHALPTFFEQVTATAMLAFKNASVEVAILETGLGGRLDSTTAAKAAIVGITPIGFDHEEYLGNTLAQIAGEKAAIIRPGAEVVIAPQPKEALSVIQTRCEVVGAAANYYDWETTVRDVSDDGRFCVDYETPVSKYESVWLGLRGRHQIDNVGLAIRLAELLGSSGFSVSSRAVATGVSKATHPGRLELIAGAPCYLLDGAHNVDGARTLREYLAEFQRRPITIVFGVMNDKRIEEIADILFPLANRVVVTEITNPRSARIERLEAIAKKFLPRDSVKATQTSNGAISLARSVTPQDGLICITGSLYLIGETRAQLIRTADGENC